MQVHFKASVWFGILAAVFFSSCSTSKVSPSSRSEVKPSLVALLQPKAPVERARDAWNALSNPNLTEAQAEAAIKKYHLAVDEVVMNLKDQLPLRHWTEWMSVESKKGESYPIQVDLGRRGVEAWSPHLFDDLNQVKLKVHIKTDDWCWDGLGRIYVGERKPRASDPNKRFLPPRGQFLPVTAILDFSGGEKAVPKLRLLDPREVHSIKIGKREWKVAADYLSAAHRSLSNRSALKVAFGGLIRPEKWLEHEGLYLTEPYRGDKIPVVFVHGLFSEPHIWENHVRAIMADPEIGHKVQCWYYIYPTGLPIASSAAHLRRALKSVQEIEDPQNKNANPQKMMLIGHSMGGILSRLQVTDSGYTFWNAWFSRPPDEIPLAEPVKNGLTQNLFFKPDPAVDRVVFIATPHRGSDMANSWIGRVTSALIRLPVQTMESVTSMMSMNLDFVRIELGKKQFSLFNSIGSLSPNHPMLVAMDRKNIEVPHHSIIGRWGGAPSLEASSDGVVPYKSSHLDSAESEVIVPYWHGCVAFPETVQEVLRIANLHVKSSELRVKSSRN